VRLYLNGRLIEVSENLLEFSLLEYIRDQALLKGTKFGCGKGLCGACTVHVNGIAERSCQLKMSEVADQQITTIEGLSLTSGGDQLHPVQDAWIEESVPQCGYCQPGQIMSAAALLMENPNPTDLEIREGMSGNICRCGTYERIHRAIARVARKN
jgi:isoquinoline 1-oxidoreductase alpha subunit